MERVHRQLMQLIRAGLWGMEADATLFDGTVEWNEILNLARQQTVMGICYDGMNRLPAELRPPRPLFLQWSNAVLQMEENNHLLNREIQQIFSFYMAQGVTPLLLKGQGVAQNYANPLRRQCGDIDIYIGKEDYERANELIAAMGGELDVESSKHAHIHLHGVTVENHRLLTQFAAPSANRFLKSYMNGCLPGNRTVPIEGYQVPVLPLELDVVFVLVHLTLHFISGGIGLRQLCDWACLLHHQKAQIDAAEVCRLLEGVGLLRAARVVGSILVSHVGLPQEELPFVLEAADWEKGEWLLQDILASGNFGFYGSFRRNRPNGWLSGKWWTFSQSVRRCYEFHSLAPAEACWYPIKLISTFISIRLNRWFS
ncbi:MAG: hypothetical protein E7099_02020 [Mediterranea massiliensis]|nr:hypothetical protein [Mediterranea massiliensis]